jgi:hypothetical protein
MRGGEGKRTTIVSTHSQYMHTHKHTHKHTHTQYSVGVLASVSVSETCVKRDLLKRQKRPTKASLVRLASMYSVWQIRGVTYIACII